MIYLTPYTTLYTITTGILVSGFLTIIFIVMCNMNGTFPRMSPLWYLLFGAIISLRLFVSVENSQVTIVNSYYVLPLIDDFFGKSRYFFFGKLEYNFLKLALFIWFMGAVLSQGRSLLSYSRLCRRLKFAAATDNIQTIKCLQEIRHRYKLSFPVRVIESQFVASPVEFGFFRQTILLPCREYTYKELSCILLHELFHFKYKTNWIKFIIGVIGSLFWWNPLVRMFEKTLKNVLEIYCDRLVTNEMNRKEKLDYLQCMLDTVKLSAPSSLQGSDWLFAFAAVNEQLKMRFEAILNLKVRNRPSCALITFILLLITIGSYGFVIQPGYQPPEENFREITPDESNSYIAFEDGIYVLYYEGEMFTEFTTIPEHFACVPVVEKGGE